MAGIYDYINRFWAEAERSPFNPTEVALYHYLLYEANRLRWEMPFACHTAILCVRLSTTKQNISKARQHLMERGLIEFQAGTGIRTPALYSLTLQTPRQLPQQITPQLSRELTVQLTHSNIEDKDKNKDKDIIYSQSARDDGHKPLDELETILLADTAWQDKIIGVLAKTKPSCWQILHGRTRLSECWQKEKTTKSIPAGCADISVTSSRSRESEEAASGTKATAGAISTTG